MEKTNEKITNQTKAIQLPLYNRLWFIMLMSAVIGAISFLSIYGFKILDPTYEEWLLQGGDLTQHYLGWVYYRKSEWQFPIGMIDGLIGNVKTAIMYTDSIPVLAVFFKLLSPVLPETFQYWGIMGLLSFMLNGACSSFLIHRFNKNGIFCIIGSILYILCPAILMRMFGHEALACHYIIILGMILWLYQDYKWKKKWQRYIMPAVLWGLLGMLSVSTHMYYIPMVYFFLLGSFITDFFKHKEISRPLFNFVSITVCSLFTMWIIGAFSINAAISDVGLGVTSANYNTLWNPAEYFGNGLSGYTVGGSTFLKPLPNFDGQYEGYAYIGFGIMTGLLISLTVIIINAVKSEGGFIKNIRNIFNIRRTWIIAFSIIFILAMFYAASPSGVLNDKKIYDIYYSENVLKFMASFRATGRFAWICDYIIFTAVIYALSRIKPKQIMTAALVICVAIQLIDIFPSIKSRRWYKQTYEINYDCLKDPRWEAAAEGCNKFVGLPYDQPDIYILEFTTFAYKHNMTINHFYVARPPFDDILAQYEKTMEELSDGKYDTNALYVFLTDEFIPDIKGLKVYKLDEFYIVKFPGQKDLLENMPEPEKTK
ncbi:MAG: DUF6311 domain-containing protein [Ruminococcus sp.]|nr:DUF6311 domain-containing protein [Ruminococcus sp.]